MFLKDVSVASYDVFKVSRVCSIALASRSISDLIHLTRWVKNLSGLALIGVCGTEFICGLNFNPELDDLTLG